MRVAVVAALLLAACDDPGDLSAVACSETSGKPCDYAGKYAKTATGACALGVFGCDGFCVGATPPSSEICDFEDNDCDNQVDEVEDVGFSFCYDGPPSTLTAPGAPCRPGVLSCVGGSWLCAGQVLPAQEECFDALDSDCDGSVDGITHDVALIVDRSCSMAGRVPRVRTEIWRLVSPYVRVWWIDLPKPSQRAVYGLNSTCHPGGSAAACVDLPAAIEGFWADGGERELSVDALADVLSGALPIAWTPGATRSVVLFVDEEPQSAQVETPAVDTSGWDVRVFTVPLFAGHYARFGEVCTIDAADLSGLVPQPEDCL